MRIYVRHSAALIALAAGLVAGTAEAQDAAAQEDEQAAEDSSDQQDSAGRARTGQEIVVTAQKSGAQQLQSVPAAIQAFTGEELKERNITSIDDLVSTIPGAYEGQRQTVGSRSYTLRGAGGSGLLAIWCAASDMP